MNDLLGSSLPTILLMAAAFVAGGLVFSPDFRSRAIALVKREKGQKPAQPQAGPPTWARQGGEPVQAEPSPPPDNGHADVEQARKILKRHGYNVRKRRRL